MNGSKHTKCLVESANKGLEFEIFNMDFLGKCVCKFPFR